MFRNMRMVSYVVYGSGCFNELKELLSEKRRDRGTFFVFIVDDVFMDKPIRERIPSESEDLVLWVNVKHEPTTQYVDELTTRVRGFSSRLPAVVLGMGGGSTMDLAKAVSLMLTNPGSSTEYQGWDLIGNPGVYHIGIPTLSGTGAEVSRTTVLTGPEKKLGINSNHTVFDQIILDPELIRDAPRDQRFFTGMDCYVHCVESLEGTYLNAFARSFGEEAIGLCREVFLENDPESEAKLMMASYFGGLSIAHAQVGICHALSYGLSFVLGIHHGIGNCIAFNRLEEYYPEGVREFRSMMERHAIELPTGLVSDIKPDDLEKMVNISLVLEPLWENALGTEWKKSMTRDKIRDLFLSM